MEDLLKTGPYEIKELSREQKQNLIDNVLGSEDDEEGTWDLEKPWYISNNPLLDSLWDDRYNSFWSKGKEYPFPYVILIGGKSVEYHYDSISKECANRLGIFLER